MQAVIFIGSGKICYGKLSQALDYGALTIQIAGDFDDAHAPRPGSQPASSASTWSTASIRSGSKGRRRSCSACWRRCAGKCPDWIVVPGGNLGNVSRASARRSSSCRSSGLIDRVPRLAVINAAGADTLYRALRAARACAGTAGSPTSAIVDNYYAELDAAQPAGRRRIASAIEINRPVNLPKACGPWSAATAWSAR